MKSVPSPDRPAPSTARRPWTAELATQYWGEDDATTVFANSDGPEASSPADAREPARKLRPRGRPRDVRPRRPGPRSPGFEGVWLAANAVPMEPARSSRLGPLLAVGLVIFGVGLAAGRLFLGGPFASLVPPPTEAAPPAQRIPVPPAPAAPAPSDPVEPPAAAPKADKIAPRAKRRRHLRKWSANSETDEAPSPDLLVPKPRSIIKVEPLDLTLPAQ